MDTVPPAFVRFLTFLTLPSPRGRAQDAWEMHRELQALREDVYGIPHYVDFRV